ncbi:MAG: divalent metal cation transporter [Verrucomicrobia bacterium]|nr:divalent metal cation transporter [Verrucomicrobiota bacterium]
MTTQKQEIPQPSGRWWTWVGPGAIVASLTIGAGELIFSTTAGALFRYDILWFFLLTLVAKWVLVVATARSFVLTGVHPLERWRALPGPPGWLLWIFLLLAVACFPVWVGFHAGTVGSLIAHVTGTSGAIHHAAHYVWGMLALALTMGLVFKGGYAVLERIQLAVVGLMLVLVLISLFLIHPDWGAMVRGLLFPTVPRYPDWISEYPAIAQRPLWVEVITYVGVLGGSGYDYLAYVSYLRDKQWGRAGRTPLPSAAHLVSGASRERAWLKVLYVDATVSFAAVLIFSLVFVACGATILAPQHKVPVGSNLLSLQAEFLTGIHPWLGPVYFVGAFLAMAGTLYGTIEVSPAIMRELLPLVGNGRQPDSAALRTGTVSWVAVGGFAVLGASVGWALLGHRGSPPLLVEILTPANLFTGVLACGFISLLNPWIERRALPEPLRMPVALRWAGLLSGLCFLALGFKAYADQGPRRAILMAVGTLLAGWACAVWARRRAGSATPPGSGPNSTGDVTQESKL